jgi:hypothetical protein
MDPAAALHSYVAARGVTGVVAIVKPHLAGREKMIGRRTAGVPVFAVDRSDPGHWRWVPVPGSEAGDDDLVGGSSHQIAMRRGACPSDPTIEQFDPAIEWRLYVVERAHPDA